MSKYNAIKTVVAGITFDSKADARVLFLGRIDQKHKQGVTA